MYWIKPTPENSNLPPSSSGTVRLSRQHLWLDADLAAMVFGELTQVYLIYYPQQKALMLAPSDDTIFPTLHKAVKVMLKSRNLQGDKTVTLQELLIDQEIDDTDRDLPFTVSPDMRLLHITL